MAKKVIFLGYATGVKGYRLWCPDSKSPKFVISRDIIFDKHYMLQPRKDSIIDSTGPGEEASKQMGLESKVTEEMHESTYIEQVDDAQSSTSGDDTSQK